MANRNMAIFGEINITPLTDIFLVLLIIMMVVAPMLDYPGLKLSVPTVGPDAETTEEPKTIQVKIDAQDKLFIDNAPIELYALRRTLKQNMKEKPDGLIVQSHPESHHAMLVKVMDAAQLAGITKIGATQSEADAGNDAK